MSQKREKNITSNKNISSSQLTFPKSLQHYANQGWAYCLLMILILFCIRNGMILSDMWATYDGGDIPESMTVGNFAHDILDGVWRGWNCYLGATEGHTGWAILPGFVALPLYTFLGNSFLTLCQVPILFSAAIICMMYLLCTKYFDKTVAVIAVAFYVFLPRHIQEWTLYPFCDLLEAPFYSLLGISLFLKAYELHQQGPGKENQKIIMVVLFGLTSGIGVFHSEVYLFILGTIFFVCLLYEPKFLLQRKLALFFLCAFLIGLIPYFFFSPMMSLSHVGQWLTSKLTLSETYKQDNFSEWTFPNAVANLFWPVRLLSLNMLGGVPLLLIGSAIGINIQRGVRRKCSGKDDIFLLNILRIFAFSYILITATSLLAFESYVYPAVAYLCILFAIAVRDLLYAVRNTKISVLKLPILLIILIFCGYNFFQIFKEASPKKWDTELKKLTTIKGCNFYWPLGYYPPTGYKTHYTKMVEQIGKARFFDYIFPYPNPYASQTSFTIDGMTYPLKRICVNHKIHRRPFFPLHDTGFWLYGIDVTFAGLESLAQEIQNRGFSEEAKEHAFISLAVYYNSDHWMSFLLKAYKNEDVAKVVPEPYRKYFYQEFGRRLRSRYGTDPEKSAALIADLTAEQKSNIMTGFQMANQYIPAQPFSRKAGLHRN